MRLGRRVILAVQTEVRDGNLAAFVMKEVVLDPLVEVGVCLGHQARNADARFRALFRDQRERFPLPKDVA